MRVMVVFGRRDGAGKGGTIRAITECVSPRVSRVVARSAPFGPGTTRMYLQRSMQHFPAAGEVVVFDRSWYNRAGVEHVMAFCADARMASRSGGSGRGPRTRCGSRCSAQWTCTRGPPYSRARDEMLKVSDTQRAPWYIVRSDDKRRARLNCIAHLLRQIPYQRLRRSKVKLPKRSMKGAYDDQASLRGRRFVPEKY